MRIFLTGATGFLGSAVARKLIASNHQVLALCRSPAKAPGLAALRAEVFAGSIDDMTRLVEGAASTDAIAHLAFDHDFWNFAASCEADRRVIEGLGEVAAKRRLPLLVTSGTLVPDAPPGRPVTEADCAKPAEQMPRALSEVAAMAAVASGARAFVVRPAHLHDSRRQAALLALLIDLAREQGVSGYVGDGAQRWAACSLADASDLYRLALEKGEGGACYHAVTEDGVAMRDIAEAIGRHLGVPTRALTPEAATAHFGWAAHFVSTDGRASSASTRDRLGWAPTGPGLIADLDAMPRQAPNVTAA